MFLSKTVLTVICVLLTTPSYSRVFLRWTHPSVPAATRLGVSELVVPLHAKALIANARKMGYRVYAEVPISQASSAALDAVTGELAGIVLNPADANLKQINLALGKLRVRFPNLTTRVLDPRGQQPEMKGQLLTEQDGILQVSSATAQPWVTSNLALIRFDEVFHPAQIPLYSFNWNRSDAAQQEQGPEAVDYLLAVAEAGAFHADLVLDLHEKLQKDLLGNNRAAWEVLGQIRRYLGFSAQMRDSLGEPEANVGVVMDDYQKSYEPINLLARHNIPFHLLRTRDLKPQDLEGFEVLVVFTTMNRLTAAIVSDFASKGGVVVLVDSHGFFPGRSGRPVPTGERSISHKVGKGQMIEVTRSAADPEAFAQDVRRLIDNRKIAVSLWNALTTVAVSYRKPGSGEKILELVNYAQEPLALQVQIKGSFPSISYATPEYGCCKSLVAVEHDGYTEFLVPSLTIAGRVRLSERRAASTLRK